MLVCWHGTALSKQLRITRAAQGKLNVIIWDHYIFRTVLESWYLLQIAIYVQPYLKWKCIFNFKFLHLLW